MSIYFGTKIYFDEEPVRITSCATISRFIIVKIKEMAIITIEEEAFQKQRPDFSQFPAAGFTRYQHDYQFTQDFMDGQFRAVLRVSDDGQVSGNVIDRSTGEEYLPLRAIHCGPFAAQVKAAYIDLLHEIARQCFTAVPFHGNQANRLATWINQKFHDQPEFVFKKLPDYAAFREPQSQKWYGLVMNIPWSRLTDKGAHGKDKVEVIDLRCPSQQQPALLKQDGVFPGYHLSKKNWICVTLDDTLPDVAIKEMVQASRHLLTKPRAWLVPANPKYYDIMHAFVDSDTITWKQSTKVRVGDTAYMYVSAPVKAIIYRCRVVKTDIPYDYQGPELKIKRVMRLRFEKEYDHDRFTLAYIKQHGVTSVQGPRHVPAELLKELEK